LFSVVAILSVLATVWFKFNCSAQRTIERLYSPYGCNKTNKQANKTNHQVCDVIIIIIYIYIAIATQATQPRAQIECNNLVSLKAAGVNSW